MLCFAIDYKYFLLLYSPSNAKRHTIHEYAQTYTNFCWNFFMSHVITLI